MAAFGRARAATIDLRRCNEPPAPPSVNDRLSKGLAFNTPELPHFHAALLKTGFYDGARTKFGDEAWAPLQKYAGDIG